jgi:hypothetical protein
MAHSPDHIILGGFATDSGLFNDLYILCDTINHITKITNKNKLLLLVDPMNHNNVQVMNWKLENELQVVSFKRLNYEIVDNKFNGSILHSNNKTEMLYNINNKSVDDSFTLNQILDIVSHTVDERIKINRNNLELTNVNLAYLKKQLLMTEKFLVIVGEYIDKTEDQELLHRIDLVLSELTNSFNSDEILDVIANEFKHTQIIDTLTNLLNVQIKITEKINTVNI